MENRDLKQAWREFVDSGKLPEKIRPNILSSWQRCVKNGIDPWQKKPKRQVAGEEFRELLKKEERLIRLCVPFMENLFAFVAGSGFVIALSDARGILLKVLGDLDIQSMISRGGFYEGIDWSESSAGTNAIGTALFENKAIQVYSYEHFCRGAQVSTCSCAIIFDERQQAIGSISLVGYDYGVHSHTLGMAAAVAYAISYSMEVATARRNAEIANSYKTAVIDSISQGVLAVDVERRITHLNLLARHLLGLDKNTKYIGCKIQQILPPKNQELFRFLEEKQRHTDVEMMIRTVKGNERFLLSARVINTAESGYVGTVIVFEEIGRVRRIIHRMSGAVASLTFDDLVGKNARFLETVQIAKNAAVTDFNVLLLGESGTGKDVIAQAIHNFSKRRRGPYVAINCGAIPRDLIGSELFGYAEGAYTGARKGGNPGKFELAESGTIFLDEIGNMPIDMQGHLLRALEEKKIQRIGGSEIIPLNVRIIAATNQNLLEDVARGRFRQDLYYRLNVIALSMIPLRERPDDIESLVRLFYRRLAISLNKPESPIPEDYIHCLEGYPFPGNIRELQNIVERAITLSENGELSKANLPPEVLGAGGAPQTAWSGALRSPVASAPIGGKTNVSN